MYKWPEENICPFQTSYLLTWIKNYASNFFKKVPNFTFKKVLHCSAKKLKGKEKHKAERSQNE